MPTVNTLDELVRKLRASVDRTEIKLQALKEQLQDLEQLRDSNNLL